MRILISFTGVEENVPISYFINKFTLQGMFYSLFLKSEKLKNKHDEKGFKFFCFSDVFLKEEKYNIIFSSPNREMVLELKNVLTKLKYFYIGYRLFKKEGLKLLNFKVGKKIRWITGSPIVVFWKNKPFSFLKEKDYSVFFERLKENSIKKFEVFSGKKIEVEEIFSRVKIKKSVSIPLEKDGRKFNIIGSTWDLLEKEYVPKEERPFYKFLLDAGLGEKNSLGFGFVNPIKP